MSRAFAFLIGLALFSGCGKETGPGPHDPPEVSFATGVYQEIKHLAGTYKSEEGLGGLKSSLVGTLENLENYEEQPVGEHKETYKQIYNGLKELKTLADSSGSRAKINQKLKELMALAEKLPAKKPKKAASNTPSN